MKRLPVWMIGMIALITAALVWVGWDERHEVGWLPLVLGALWVLFVLGSAAKIFSDD